MAVADDLSSILSPDAKLEKLAGDLKFVEGPVWSDDDGGFLLFSDIPADVIYRWSDQKGLVPLRQPSHNANGNTRDALGRLITCEHATRRVSRTEKDGSLTVLAERYEGKKLNSPNDVVVKSDGSLWFTDPPYGLPGGTTSKLKELDGNFVFRLTPSTSPAGIEIVASDFDMPNGLCFSPDESRLYIADSGKPRHVRVFDVIDGSKLNNNRIFAVIEPGVPDGMRCDSEGRLYVTAGNGVQVFTPDGKRLGTIEVPETVANCCFGGADRKTLYMTAGKSLYRIRLVTAGK